MGQILNFLLDHKEPHLHRMQRAVKKKKRVVYHPQTLGFDLVQWQRGTLGSPSLEKGKFVLCVGISVKGYFVDGEADTSGDSWFLPKSILSALGHVGRLHSPASFSPKCDLVTKLQGLWSVTGNDVCHFQSWPRKLSTESVHVLSH